MGMKFTATNESITVIDAGVTHTVTKSAPNFANLHAALAVNDFEKARGYLTVKKAIETWVQGLFTLKNGKILRGDEELPDTLSSRILAMITKGEDPASLVNFWERLQNNPSSRSVMQLWGFLANKGIPLDHDGFILAYKAVRRDWKDVHSGTIANTVGSTHEMPRNKISDDPNEACHFGFHVGALGYAQSFGPSDRHMIICKVDPADVVCIPYDAGQQKMRTCRYEVIGVHSGNAMSSTTADTRKDPAVAAVKADMAAKKDAAKGRVDAHKANKGAPVTKVKTTVAAKAVAGTKHPFDDFDSLQLLEQLLPDLRTYAAVHLKIVGASKIAGGKTALIARIEEVRG
jgi:hypothetical protein